MNKEKKLWLIEQYAHKTWTISLALAQEAARAGNHGKGYAVIAHETRMLAEKLFDCVQGARFDGGAMATRDFAVMARFLAANAMLEIIRMTGVSMEFNIPKSMTVFAEELRQVAAGLIELDEKGARPCAIAEVASPIESARDESLFLYSVGGHQMVEYCKNIMEVCYFPKDGIKGQTLALRGMSIPVIDCFRRFGLTHEEMDAGWQTVMIIRQDGVNQGSAKGLYAVPVDDLAINAVFYSKPGMPIPLIAGHAFAGFARDCWQAAGGGQFVLADWRALAAK